MLKKLWWNIRLWLYRKLHKSLSDEYHEEENYHSLLTEHAIAAITRATSSPDYNPVLDEQDMFVGVIANDWNARINEKIREKEKNQ